MASMRDIRTRIRSIGETMQITKAMNLIASSKLKKARKQLNDIMPYFEKIQTAISELVLYSPDVEHEYFNHRKDVSAKKVGYVVISADKGLCGAYNHNVIKLAEEHMKLTSNERYLFVVGHMGRDYFRRKNYNIDVEFLYTAQDPNIRKARDIAMTLVSLYNDKLLDEIYVVFTKMESAVKLQPTVLQLLPLQKQDIHDNKMHHKNEVERKRPDDSATDFKPIIQYDPSPKVVLDSLVPNYIKGLIFGALVESFSSEQSARMTAMDAATNSAKDMIRNLTLMYNRARQAAITQEISEIVGGSEALK